MTTYKEILKIIEETPSEDETIEMLEKAVNYYCGTWDICDGYKFALKQTIIDQYENHPKDQEEDEEMNKLKAILLTT